MSLLGRGWRALLVNNELEPVALQQYDDEILLVSLASASDPRVKLHALLRQRSKEARMANRLLCAWWNNDRHCFPPDNVAAAILKIAHTAIGNRFSCNGWCDLRECPISIMALLHARLGCALWCPCCTIFCYVGCECPQLVANSKSSCLLTDSQAFCGNSRVVYIGQSLPFGFHSVFSFRPMQDSRQIVVGIWDSPDAARLYPMQLTALRASLCHRVYKPWQLQWKCSLTDSALRLRSLASAPTFVSAAFGDPGAASRWQQLADQLEKLYAGHSSTTATASARLVSDRMSAMAELLPFSRSTAVHRLLRLPLLNVGLQSGGSFIQLVVVLDERLACTKPLPKSPLVTWSK